MAETSLVWGGTALGDAASAPYDADEHGDMFRDLFMHDRADSGVFNSELTGYDGLLEVTNPAGVTLRVATGIGMVDGTMYYNSANVDNNSTSAAGQFERIVLQKIWANQTVRVALLGPAGAQPALTQNDGVQWEIPLATIENVGGVLTITDERVFLPQIGTVNLEAGAVTSNKIVAGAVDTDQFAAGAVPLLIETQTLGAPAATITFSSIPQQYTNLLIIMFARSTGAGVDTITMTFNGLAVMRYGYISTTINQAGTSAATHGDGTATYMLISSLCDTNSPANVFSPIIIEVPNYSNPSVSKCAIAHSAYLRSSVSANARMAGGYWSTPTGVTSIELTANGGSFAANTVASLYGLP